MIIRMLTLGAVETNCYIVGCEETRKGVIIDPSDEAEKILKVVEEENLHIEYVLNTHAHFDHIADHALLNDRKRPASIVRVVAKIVAHASRLPRRQYSCCILQDTRRFVHQDR